MHRGVATFTLDHGKCPKWLFERMVKLSREMVQLMVAEFGPDEVVARLGDPAWFQSLGTVLAFDWNASGLTTILTAALKESIRGMERDLGIFICGGKGKTSKKTPDQIWQWGDQLSLPDKQVRALSYNSKMTAKVDSCLVQDGYQLYHHTFFFSRNGAWTVVQQGMNQNNRTARRYHWHSRNVRDLIVEPHSGISSQKRLEKVLNMTSRASGQNRGLSLELTKSNFWTVQKDLQLLRKYSTPLSEVVSVGSQGDQLTFLQLGDKAFRTHPVLDEDMTRSKYLEKILWKLCDRKPQSYEGLVGFEGVGPKTIRALSLISEVIYGAKPSYTDPARYSFAHGGKDHIPYPVDTRTYDRSIEIFRKLVKKMRVDQSEKRKMMERIEGVRN